MQELPDFYSLIYRSRIGFWQHSRQNKSRLRLPDKRRLPRSGYDSCPDKPLRTLTGSRRKPAGSRKARRQHCDFCNYRNKPFRILKNSRRNKFDIHTGLIHSSGYDSCRHRLSCRRFRRERHNKFHSRTGLRRDWGRRRLHIWCRRHRCRHFL